MTGDQAGLFSTAIVIGILVFLNKLIKFFDDRRHREFSARAAADRDKPIVPPMGWPVTTPPDGDVLTAEKLDAFIAAQRQDAFDKWAATCADREVVLVARYYFANGIESDWCDAAHRAVWEKTHPGAFINAMETRIQQTRDAWQAANADHLCILKKESPQSPAKGS